MPRGPKLTPGVEDLIARACIDHPEWISKPKKIQGWVIDNLSEQQKVWGGPNWPGIDVIQDRLRKKIRPNIQNRTPESKRLDQPWSIGALVRYPIPQECLPVVLRAFYAERRTDVKTSEYFRIGYETGHSTYLTIREALWMARLSVLFKYPTIDVSANTEEDIAQYARFNLVTAKLVDWAHTYSRKEQIAEILEKPLDTSDLDIGFYLHARDEIYPTLVSYPRLIRFSWEDTRNHLKKEAQNER
ncbi:hypothetical protein ACFLVF_01120 [Chloroflexota bacterium]